MVPRPRPRDDRGPEASRGIQAAACVEHACQFGDEEREADADWGEEGGFVLFGGEEEDREDELAGEEHFEEEALGDVDVGAERGGDVEGAGEYSRSDCGGGNGAGDLGDEAGDAADGFDGTDEVEG